MLIKIVVEGHDPKKRMTIASGDREIKALK
jgi:hypothetical protein